MSLFFSFHFHFLIVCLYIFCAGQSFYLFICLAHFPFCILINMLPTRHPSYFCRNSNSDSLKKRHTSKMRGSERNMINRWKSEKNKKRNIWGRKKYSKSSFCECVNRCHTSIFFSFRTQNMYIQSCFFSLFSFYWRHQRHFGPFNASRLQTIKSLWCIKLQAS